MPFEGKPFDRLTTFLKDYGNPDHSLAGLCLKEIHKMTLTAIIEDDLNNINIKVESFKFQLKSMPNSLQDKLMKSIIPACYFCRNCFNGYSKFESIGNCPVDRYLFWMKTSVTLSATKGSCKERMKYHYPMFMSGLHYEDFEKEDEEQMKQYEQECGEEFLNDIYECISMMFQSQ